MSREESNFLGTIVSCLSSSLRLDGFESRPDRKAGFERSPFLLMPHYVYILESQSSGIRYKGYTSDIRQRLIDHNNNESRFTAGKGPWKLVYISEFPDKRSALIQEKKLKRSNQIYLRWLIDNHRPSLE